MKFTIKSQMCHRFLVSPLKEIAPLLLIPSWYFKGGFCVSSGPQNVL